MLHRVRSLVDRKLTAEHIILVSAMAVALWAYLEAEAFREPSHLFPQFTAAVMFVGATLLLFRNHLPEPLHSFVTKDPELMSSDGEEFGAVLEEEPETGVPAPPAEATTPDRTPTGAVRALFSGGPASVGFMTGAYIVAAYLIGFLYATPLFAAAYARIVDHPWYIAVPLVIGTTVIVYLFGMILVVPLSDGILLG